MKEKAMKIGKITAALAFTAALGASASALAWDDETGLTSLGIDISRAGSSPEAISTFIAGLNPEGQRGVLHGCEAAVSQPAGFHENVIGFCQTVVGLGGVPQTQMLGFAGEEPAFVAPFPGEEAPMTVAPSSGSGSGTTAY
jgi:hypothetical protein